MLGARIAALRQQAGMSQSALAKSLGTSASAVGMYEQGRREPSAQMLLALARAFGVSVDFLLTGKPPEQDTNQLRRMLLDRLEAADSRLEQRKSRPFSREELAVLMAAMLLEG